jgi:hypothetical protein
MPTAFADAFAPIASLTGIACELVGLRPAALAADGGADGDAAGDGGDAIEAVIFDWSALSADQRGELIVDFLGDAFLEADGDYVALHADADATGSPEWLPADLIPFALVGPPGLTERGARWDVAGSIDAVLFLDLAGGSASSCPVIAWFAGPTTDLVEIASDVAALGLRPLPIV